MAQSLGAAALFVSVGLAASAGLAGLLVALGAPPWLQACMIVPGVAIGLRAARSPAPPERRSTADAALTIAIVLAAGLWALWLFGAGALPVGDPIAVPQFARSLAVGAPLTDAFPPGTSGHAYPPGYPLLFAPVEAWLRPDQALLLFKAVSVGVAALIPLAWAGLHRALFSPSEPAWRVTLAAYAAFILLERHLGFLTPFAGKNALEFALLLFPGVVLAAIRLCETPRWWPLAAAPLFGLFLIHYSMLHLAIAFLAAYLLASRSWRWPLALRLAAAGAMATALLLVAAGEAMRDPRVAASAWTPLHGAAALLRTLIAAQPEVVIFHDSDFGLAPASYRMIVLAACVAAALGLAPNGAGLRRAAAAYALAIAASLAFGYGLVPAHINVDFVRCFLWPLQAMVFMTAGLALVARWRQWRPAWRWAAAAAAIPACAAILTVALQDMRVERETFQRLAPPRGAMRQIVQALPQERPCFLITRGQARPEVLVTVQDAAAWNYAEALSPCMFVGGSWVHFGWPGGRELDGLPSARSLTGLPAGIPIFFVGTRAQLAAYADALSAEGLRWSWRPAGSEVAGASLWRADPSRQEQAEATSATPG